MDIVCSGGKPVCLCLSNYTNANSLTDTLSQFEGRKKKETNICLTILHSNISAKSLEAISCSNFFFGLNQLIIENYSSIESLKPLYQMPKNMENLTTLSFRSCQDLNLIELMEILSSQAVRNLKKLDLSETLITGDTLEAIAASTTLKELEDLNIGNCFKINSDSAFDNLLGSDNVLKLKKLTLTNLPIEDHVILAISYSAKLGNLEYLDIGFCSLLKDFGVESFFFSKNCQKIKFLSLENTKITSNLLKEIVKSSLFTEIRELSFHECYAIAPEGFKELFSKGGHLFENLEKLTVSLTKIDSDGVLALANNQKIRKLRVLKIFDVPKVSNDALKSLFLSQTMQNITNLDLTYQALNQTILETLANSPFLSNLEELSLSRCAFVASPGVNTFLNSNNALKLKLFCLASTGVDSLFSNEAIRLLESGRLNVLNVIDIRRCEKLSYEEKLDFYLKARHLGANVFTEFGFK